MSDVIFAAAGGAFIGISAVLLMALTGRIAGISGILAALLPPKPASDWSWRVAFLTGLVAAPLFLQALAGDNFIGAPAVGLPTLLAAGFLVGCGTVLGSGCTSGHGICGVARLSRRSFVAVAVFVAVAMITVFVTHHVA